jgi:predicted DNA-binding transcriptional regulator YafY
MRRDATPALVQAAIATLKAGQGSSSADLSPTTGDALEPMPAAETMAVLRRAIANSLMVRLGYGDDEGLVDPLRLQAGMLTAVDRITGEVRTFAVSRIVAADIPDHVH